MKVLIVSKTPTHSTIAGNRWGVLSQAKMLKSLGCEVHFLYVHELPLRRRVGYESYSEDLALTASYWGVRFHLYNVSKLQKLWFDILLRIRRIFFSSQCGKDDMYPVGIEKYVNALDKKYHFDICIVNYYFLTKLFTYISIPVCAVFTHDYFAYKNQVVGEKIDYINADSEATAVQRAGHIFAVQNEEYAYYRLIAPRSEVYNIYGAFEHKTQKTCNNHKIVFLSGENQFNINGIEWFVSDILPFIRKEFNDACLIIGGGICRKLTHLKDTEGVKLFGYVDDPFSFYACADVAVNPVSQGTGLKIKTFEAISYDKVTLVHPHSSRGIFDAEHAPIVICSRPEDWISALKQIWGDNTFIEEIKLKNAAYISSMTDFVKQEYARFLSNAKLNVKNNSIH